MIKIPIIIAIPIIHVVATIPISDDGFSFVQVMANFALSGEPAFFCVSNFIWARADKL